jgi:choline dehydrogenase-like flavoprotein
MRHEVAVDVSNRSYDVVIVGAGIAGSIMAKALANRGRRVLILEGGVGQALDYRGYLRNLDIYYENDVKVPNSPYPRNPNSPQSDLLDVISNSDFKADSQGYLVQSGPNPFTSDFARVAGGTTLHWLGTCLRMLPEDFETQKRFGVGLDWPISYDDLRPYYNLAEYEIGVAAEIEDQLKLQRLLGIKSDWFDPGYVYPMHRIPPSYLDRFFENGTADLSIDYDGREYPLRVTSTPQGRNGIPNTRYPGGYTPVGAVGNPDLGQRCQGNSACVPICPVQAKYNGMKSLDAAVATGRVDVVTQAVASFIRHNANGRITSIEYKAYRSPDSPAYDIYSASGTIFVLAAHVVENVKLLLASNLGGDATGRYLMDHPTMLTWGQSHEALGTFRGPGSSSGFESVRGGEFRKSRAPFRIEIDNWGWNWATGAPQTTVQELVFSQAKFGHNLRRELFHQTQRQVRLGFLLEIPPMAANRIRIDNQYKDPIDNFRPIIYYEIPEYTKAGMAEAKRTSNLIYAKLGITDLTRYKPDDIGYLNYKNVGYTYQGAGHYIGGHIMGHHRHGSVVNTEQRMWGHENLWLVGCGNMVTEGTSNPTLTMAALTFMAADRIEQALGR